MPYLLKTEPGAYSFADLERDRETVWDGVTSAAAVKHLREMKAGDRVIIFHTGAERQAVGSASVVAVNADDPKNPRVTIKVSRALTHLRNLAEIKQHRLFAASPLVKQGRLSVVPLTDGQYNWLVKS